MKQLYDVLYHLTPKEDWLINCWITYDSDLVSVIMRERGWMPLTKGEEVTIHYNGKKYVIKREK